MSEIRIIAACLLATSCVLFVVARVSPAPLECEGAGVFENEGDDQYCEVREFTLPPRELLTIRGRDFGDIRIIGREADEISVKAQVVIWGRARSAAESLANRIDVQADGVLDAAGPRNRRGGWSVNYEIRAPLGTAFNVRAQNGDIHVTDVEGDIELATTNGALFLDGVSGTVSGNTTIGGVKTVLSGNSLEGFAVDIQATRGGGALRLPAGLSTILEAQEQAVAAQREGHDMPL